MNFPRRTFELPRFTFLAVFATVALFASIAPSATAQSGKVTNQQRPGPPPAEDDPDRIRVITEEVRLPIFATDLSGRYDPTLVPDDVLVLEDGVPQQVQSVRHTPPHVVLLLDTGGGDGVATSGNSKSTSLTRRVAQQTVDDLAAGAQVAVIQAGERVETIQDWTDDKRAAYGALESKLLTTKRSRLLEGISVASAALRDKPEGGRHIILISDGVEGASERVKRLDAMSRLNAARATVHVISYTQFVQRTRAAAEKRSADPGRDQERIRAIARAGLEPGMPPGQSRGTFGGTPGSGITFDPAMRRTRKEYESKVRKGEQSLTAIAQQSGGRIFLPKSDEEMITAGAAIARDIGTQYIATYRPKRPLASASPGEYRRLSVAPRKLDLVLRARPGYVVP